MPLYSYRDLFVCLLLESEFTVTLFCFILKRLVIFREGWMVGCDIYVWQNYLEIES